MACGCPTTSAHTSIPVAVAIRASLARHVRCRGTGWLTTSQMAVGDLVLGAGAVDDRPAVGVLHRLEEEAVVHAAVERVAGGLEAVLGAVEARLGGVGAHLEQHHEVGPAALGRPARQLLDLAAGSWRPWPW